MKYLILLFAIATGCCLHRDKGKSDLTPLGNNVPDSTTLCEVEFNQFLRDSLKYMERPQWFPHVVLKRNDNFVKLLQEKFASCIKGKSREDIISLFGKPRYQDASELNYDCIEKDDDAKNGDEMCLIFRLEENQRVKYISYYDCWALHDKN